MRYDNWKKKFACIAVKKKYAGDNIMKKKSVDIFIKVHKK